MRRPAGRRAERCGACGDGRRLGAHRGPLRVRLFAEHAGRLIPVTFLRRFPVLAGLLPEAAQRSARRPDECSCPPIGAGTLRRSALRPVPTFEVVVFALLRMPCASNTTIDAPSMMRIPRVNIPVGPEGDTQQQAQRGKLHDQKHPAGFHQDQGGKRGHQNGAGNRVRTRRQQRARQMHTHRSLQPKARARLPGSPRRHAGASATSQRMAPSPTRPVPAATPALPMTRSFLLSLACLNYSSC